MAQDPLTEEACRLFVEQMESNDVLLDPQFEEWVEDIYTNGENCNPNNPLRIMDRMIVKMMDDLGQDAIPPDPKS